MFYEWGCCHMLAGPMWCQLSLPPIAITVPWDVVLYMWQWVFLLLLLYCYPPSGAFTVSVTKRLRKFTPILVSVNVRRVGSRQCMVLLDNLNVIEWLLLLQTFTFWSASRAVASKHVRLFLARMSKFQEFWTLIVCCAVSRVRCGAEQWGAQHTMKHHSTPRCSSCAAVRQRSVLNKLGTTGVGDPGARGPYMTHVGNMLKFHLHSLSYIFLWVW